jgi:YARHG domain
MQKVKELAEHRAQLTGEQFTGERYPQTRQRLITLEDIKAFGAGEVQYAINEIYARNGATFRHPDVVQQFQKFDWYQPRPGLAFSDIDHLMSDVERANLKLLAQYRASMTRP